MTVLPVIACLPSSVWGSQFFLQGLQLWKKMRTSTSQRRGDHIKDSYYRKYRIVLYKAMHETLCLLSARLETPKVSFVQYVCELRYYWHKISITLSPLKLMVVLIDKESDIGEFRQTGVKPRSPWCKDLPYHKNLRQDRAKVAGVADSHQQRPSKPTH